MKRNFYRGLLLLVGFPLVFGACKKDDDPEPPKPIEGTWNRDVYQLTNLPAGFMLLNNVTTTDLYGSAQFPEEGYTFTFKADGTFERKIAFEGPDLNDTGKYTLDGTKLSINSDNDQIDDEEFTVVGEISKTSMVVSQIFTFNLLPDAIADTLSQAWYDTHADEVDAKRQPIDVTILFLFEK